MISPLRTTGPMGMTSTYAGARDTIERKSMRGEIQVLSSKLVDNQLKLVEISEKMKKERKKFFKQRKTFEDGTKI
jgi:hypothetical protein